jgi:hypothetical protein
MRDRPRSAQDLRRPSNIAHLSRSFEVGGSTYFVGAGGAGGVTSTRPVPDAFVPAGGLRAFLSASRSAAALIPQRSSSASSPSSGLAARWAATLSVAESFTRGGAASAWGLGDEAQPAASAAKNAKASDERLIMMMGRSEQEHGQPKPWDGHRRAVGLGRATATCAIAAEPFAPRWDFALERRLLLVDG